MSLCRFEDRWTGQALVLEQPVDRITACQPEALRPALAAIEQHQAAGRWIALLMTYDLGEWLEPRALQAPISSLPAPEAVSVQASRSPTSPFPSDTPQPRLTALVFEQARTAAPWLPAAHQAGITAVQPRMARADYLSRIERIRELIRAGEVYQINYTFGMDIETEGSPEALYRRIAHGHPSAHAAYIEDQDGSVLSFSPELFMQRRGHHLTCRPMKGTAPRHPDPVRDQALGQALLDSIKNRAENLMIVDLLRNDMGRLAVPGSVRVPRLFELESYPSVWTLTSTIEAELPPLPLHSLLTALFPCGSITGAPKIAAMQHIRQLEPEPRGLYCGSIGWLAPNGDFSLNVAIRTLVLHERNHGRYHVGGGIVHDSIPEQEWEECLWKARILNATRLPN
ncbi:aminodeoxychorismate synthase component I [Corticimicrobacter populi]|uniref:Aminodeoxychorismate synthase component I n=1 Tax=Corticimicrobacter populi TaxID=2175229 RepID=A0A2V1K5T8_9BURK|nr:aminodeoxychorismate synthase component I [Corticimicrobacter populi]PWF24937.1 aminodeoxychorismate synthase component I [Corticimicrobacter populi]